MDSNGLGKLLKRRRKKQAKDADGSAETDDVSSTRGRSFKSRETFESDGTNSTNMADEEDTSFVSYESDPES
jgi:hypothetical protein